MTSSSRKLATVIVTLALTAPGHAALVDSGWALQSGANATLSGRTAGAATATGTNIDAGLFTAFDAVGQADHPDGHRRCDHRHGVPLHRRHARGREFAPGFASFRSLRRERQTRHHRLAGLLRTARHHRHGRHFRRTLQAQAPSTRETFTAAPARRASPPMTACNTPLSPRHDLRLLDGAHQNRRRRANRRPRDQRRRQLTSFPQQHDD